MNKKILELMIVFSPCCLLGKTSKVVQGETSKFPNIVFILSDDHSYPYLGCYGDISARTKSLDKFASEGMKFNLAFTDAPQSAPSRASMMTGRSPIDVNMSRFSASLDSEIITFPEILRNNGYYTGVVGRYYHLDGPFIPDSNTQRVIDKYNIKSNDARFDFVMTNHKEDKTKVDGKVISLDVNDKNDISEKVVHFLETADKNKPYFLWVNFTEPHRSWPFSHHLRKNYNPDDMLLPPDFPDIQSVRHDLVNFYAELESLDKQFEKVIDVLEKNGSIDNTIIVFMGDNGGAWLRGKGTLYERGVHVPLLIKWASKVKPNTECNELVQGSDLAPTLLQAVGLKPDKKMTGKSFLPLLTGELEDYIPRTAVFNERGAHAYGLPTSMLDFDLSRSIRTKKYRLIYNVLWDRPYRPNDIDDYKIDFWSDMKELNKEGKLDELHSRLFFSPRRELFELYDLESDPYELNNLSGKEEYKEIELDLKNQLAEWMILQHDFVPLPTEKIYTPIE